MVARLSARARPLSWRSAEPGRPSLIFRSAKEEEAPELKALYEGAWGNGITIAESQLVSKMRMFPEGQIVGEHPDSGLAASMINIMLAGFDGTGFTPGYEKVSGGRTFSTHTPLEQILDNGQMPVALCMSIAVRKEFSQHGYALETLNHAIRFAEENGILAVPYSAPRGFASAREKNPSLEIVPYLHMSVPSGMTYDEHIARVRRINHVGRIARAFRMRDGVAGVMEVTGDLYREYQEMGRDRPDTPWERLAYFRFFARDGEQFFKVYGRYPLMEDFCLLTGRKPLDSVMRMHVDNGARFIRDGSASLSGVFEGSRPEDKAALGYNVLLTYGYHPLLGQDYVES